MENSNDNKSAGFYGPDGEYYPASSQAARAQSEASTQYPKRPDINYTTTAYPGANQPANRPDNNLNDSMGGYTGPTKFCKFCGQKIPEKAVICTHCGCQVEEMKQNAPQPTPVIINNSNNNVNYNKGNGSNKHEKSKWVAFFLCLFLGEFGAHKFYEGKILMGILYLCTVGFFGIGWIIDLIILLFKPNPYYV